jgi:alginate O-acetyltransferase complex protein AlgI
MIFSSHLFIFYFLPLVLALNYSVPFRYLSLMLVIVSYCFYGWTNPAWVLLMFASTFIDYCCGLALVRFSGLAMAGNELPLLPPGGRRNSAQKMALTVSMVSNLAILGFFKYYDFGAATLNRILETAGWGPDRFQLLHIALPIGISFYTFQSMSYGIDVYRGNARALRRPIDFACFVALFPHQLAGPIIRFRTIADQFRARSLTFQKFARGAAFFSFGLTKKILLANAMAHVADTAFGARQLSCLEAWYGVIAYAFQIYFDFSGYSDIAVGLALMLGFLFTRNFNDPYRAPSITEFWRRWHIALSTWLRDYLYVPLGGNRKGAARTYFNLMIVMLLGGLWHGASWNFVVWGGIHGSMLGIERLQGRNSLYCRLPHVFRVAVTFAIVCMSWVVFRANTLSEAWVYLQTLAGTRPAGEVALLLGTSLFNAYHVAMFIICATVVWAAPQAWHFTQRLTLPRAAMCVGLMAVSVVFMWTQTVNPFLYFRF